MNRANLHGLYAITRPGADLLATTAAILRGGARLIQYRDKSADAAQRRETCAALVSLCRQFNAPLIVNDDVALAAACGAQGVHLGQRDAGCRQARERLGANAIIGVSCHASLALGVDAERAGANYAAFGSCFPSPTKPDAAQAPLALLTQARGRLTIPIVAIGGINPTNAAMIRAAGAHMAALISALYDAPNPEAAARALHHLWHHPHP